MLKKLLKHEILKDAKFLSIYYIITLGVAVISRLLTPIDGSLVLEIIARIFSGATISMMVAVIINNVMRLWAHFKSSMYGDEAYLTHTLPVKRSSVYFAKLLAAITTMLASFTVCVAALAIAFYSKDNLQTVKLLLDPMAEMYDSSVIYMVAMVLLLIFLELLNMVQCGYVGIVLGHRCRQGKTGMSVLFGIAVYSAGSCLLLLLAFLLSFVSTDLNNLFITQTAVDPKTLKELFYIATAGYFMLNLVMVIISNKLLKKGVNVD